MKIRGRSRGVTVRGTAIFMDAIRSRDACAPSQKLAAKKLQNYTETRALLPKRSMVQAVCSVS